MPRVAPDPRAPDKGAAVRGMFASIAPRYDRLNRLLSLGLDRRWRRALLAHLPALAPHEPLLDLCTGTGDLALTLRAGLGPAHPVLGADFCEEMVARAPAKARGQPDPPRFLVADALALPFGPGRFGALTVAFGLRNVQDPAAALAEAARALRPGGRLLILDFHRPQNRVFAALYGLYFLRVLPRVGRWLARSPVDAYRYLPESVWAWPSPAGLAGLLEQAGLSVLQQRPFLFGAVVLHVAERRDP